MRYTLEGGMHIYIITCTDYIFLLDVEYAYGCEDVNGFDAMNKYIFLQSTPREWTFICRTDKNICTNKKQHSLPFRNSQSQTPAMASKL